MSLPTVFVVDDDRDFRESLVALLSALGHSAQGFASADAFVSSYDPERPGCLVLDIRMPGRSGIELYADLLTRGWRLPVIFVTAHADVTTAVAAMKTGAIEFLEKPFEKARLADLVQRALKLDTEWRSSEEQFQQLDQSIGRLNDTDRQTLAMIFEGATNKAMAARFFISERAVELRRQRLMQRLGVRSVPELIHMALTHQLLSEVRTARNRVIEG